MPAKRETGGFSDEERAAMRERAKELRAAPRASKTDGEAAVLAAIAKMPEPYRSMGKRLHEIIRASAPGLSPRTWYGMPAYADEDGVVCFFRGGEKFKERYMTFGFNDAATIDEGRMWPVAFALTAITEADEARIAALVKRAVSGPVPTPADR